MRPRLRSAGAGLAAHATADLRRWTHRVGVILRRATRSPPPGTLSHLARPGSPASTVAQGEPSPWRSVLPPSGGGSAARRGLLCACLALCLALFLCIAPTQAVEPGEVLKDAALEARARRLSQELRCLVCQNQSIDDSNAELARDLRVLVRERLSAGDSDAAVLAFVEARYGAFVLLRPPFNPHTLLLWLTPLLLLAGTAVLLLRRTRVRSAASTAPAAPLTPAEQARLDRLLADKP